MTGAQLLAGAGGVGLVLANEWTGPDHAALGSVLWDRSADPAAAHDALKRLGAELLFVVGLVLVAGVGGQWTTAVLAAVAALWVLWAINRTAPKGAN